MIKGIHFLSKPIFEPSRHIIILHILAIAPLECDSTRLVEPDGADVFVVREAIDFGEVDGGFFGFGGGLVGFGSVAFGGEVHWGGGVVLGGFGEGFHVLRELKVEEFVWAGGGGDFEGRDVGVAGGFGGFAGRDEGLDVGGEGGAEVFEQLKALVFGKVVFVDFEVGFFGGGFLGGWCGRGGPGGGGSVGEGF